MKIDLATALANVPAIGATAPSEKMSDKYVFTSSTQLVEDMATLGFDLCHAIQVRPNRRSGRSASLAKHRMQFRSNKYKVIETTNGETTENFLEVLVTNSHDGSSAFVFEMGIWRLVCSNGLTIKTKEYGGFRIKHVGYTFDELRDRIREMIKHLPKLVEVMSKMQQVKLTDEQKTEFALAAIRLRSEKTAGYVDVAGLLEAKRNMDMGDSLWQVFNGIQEKLVNGEYAMLGDRPKGVRKPRAIKSIDGLRDLNSDLFDLAAKYLETADAEAVLN